MPAEIESFVIANAHNRAVRMRTADDYRLAVAAIEAEARAWTSTESAYRLLTNLPATRAMLENGQEPMKSCMEEIIYAYERLNRIRYHLTGERPSID